MSVLQWTSLAQTITGHPNNTNSDDNDNAKKDTPHHVQPPTTKMTARSPIGVRFVSDEVKRDHRDLEILYKGLVQAIDEGDDPVTTALLDRFSWELARHLVAMQLFVFPGTEQRADAGNGKALQRRGDLATIRDHLLHLVDLDPSDANFRPVLARLTESLKQHIHDVERADLVAIERALDGEESERLARDWESAGRFVPDGDEGGRERRKVPFETVKELLGASYSDIQSAWEVLRDGDGRKG